MITAVQLPLPWDRLGFPAPLQTGPVTLASGAPGWSWGPHDPPDLGIPMVSVTQPAMAVEGWGMDHVVLAVDDFEAAAQAICAVAGDPRRRTQIRGRLTGFWIVGTLLEVVEDPGVQGPMLYGVCLVTDEALEAVARRWASKGFAVTGPRQAFQPGRRILTVGGLGAGLAVMSPRRVIDGRRSVEPEHDLSQPHPTHVERFEIDRE